jgi:hypothetical protein
MPADAELQRALGNLEGRHAALEDRVARHEQTTTAWLTQIDAKLDTLVVRFASAVGGFRVGYAIVAAVAMGGMTIGAAAVQWLLR